MNNIHEIQINGNKSFQAIRNGLQAYYEPKIDKTIIIVNANDTLDAYIRVIKALGIKIFLMNRGDHI